jgi:glutaredoxin
MNSRIVFFTQPGCLSCELMKCFLEAKEVVFEERDISTDVEARRQMVEQHGSGETPTLVIFSIGLSNDLPMSDLTAGHMGHRVQKVVIGFDPLLLDQLLDPIASDSATKNSVTKP